jgi:gamma-glutamylcyclotransferase (GGCT)/AIG2-like uncharacterized protein YtfP
MSQDSLIYFAYGANMNRRHMALWCPHSEPLEAAMLPDFRLVFRFWCDMLPAPGQYLPGALYRVPQEDMRWLDDYEDCPRLYVHENVTVTTTDGRQIEAMTYRMRPGHAFAPPDRQYLAIVRQGYIDWDYDAGVLPVM